MAPGGRHCIGIGGQALCLPADRMPADANPRPKRILPSRQCKMQENGSPTPMQKNSPPPGTRQFFGLGLQIFDFETVFCPICRVVPDIFPYPGQILRVSHNMFIIIAMP